MTTRLSVNLNKIALLRNSRSGDLPSVTRNARTALEAGAMGITLHPRPDRRHVLPHDVIDCAEIVREKRWQSRDIELNIEGNPFVGDWLEIVTEVKPDQCTLVPDDPDQRTSDHGWDVSANLDRLSEMVTRLHGLGARVSLFMDPNVDTIAQVPRTGADRIELYTESYAIAHAAGSAERTASLDQFAAAANQARDCGLGVNAGHDLNLANLPDLIARLGAIDEVSIGHALTADALDMGFAEAVRAYVSALQTGDDGDTGQK